MQWVGKPDIRKEIGAIVFLSSGKRNIGPPDSTRRLDNLRPDLRYRTLQGPAG